MAKKRPQRWTPSGAVGKVDCAPLGQSERKRVAKTRPVATCSRLFTVACFESASGLFRPVPPERYWPYLRPGVLDDRFHETGIDETGSMELEGCWWIPRLRLAERGAVSWQDGVKRSRWR